MPDPPIPDRPQPRWTVDDDIRIDRLPILNFTDAEGYAAFVRVRDIWVGPLSHCRRDKAFAALVADVHLARRAEAEDWETKARQWDQARELGVAATPASGTFCSDDSRIWLLLHFLAGGDDA